MSDESLIHIEINVGRVRHARDIDVISRVAVALQNAMDEPTELERLRKELADAKQQIQEWMAFREGDVGVVHRIQQALETGKSKASTREGAIYDRINQREREAFEAGEAIACHIPSGPPDARKQELDRYFTAFVIAREEKKLAAPDAQKAGI